MPKKIKVKKILRKGVRDKNVKSADVIRLIKRAGRRKGK
mgnify:CR=1 FL=1